MSSSEYNTTYAAPDMLQTNMENISKELNDLIVTGEQEFGMTPQFSAPIAASETPATPPIQNNFQVPRYYGQFHQSSYAANEMQFFNKHNLNYLGVLQQPTMTFVNNAYNIAPNQTRHAHLSGAGKYNFSYTTLGTSQTLRTNVADTPPTYEFHYLRSSGEYDKKFSSSSSSLGSSGAYRKIPRFAHKHFGQRTQNAALDNNDHIKMDLSDIDLFNTNNENSTVRHLFDLLRDLHRALSETTPSMDANDNSQYVDTFASVDSRKSAMPSTLNVQNQVKQACRKLTIFTCDMQRILVANKMYDPHMYAECEFYWNTLRQYLNQLEIYKSIEMEHKRGQFLKEKVKAHAERLSLLLEHINRQIREVHIRLVAFDWYIGVKYRGDVTAASAMQQSNDNYKENSKIGVINEILQMCNTPSTPPNPATNTMETTTPTKPEMTNTTNSSIKSPENKLINDNKDDEVVNVKPLLNKIDNNNIFNVYKPDQIRKVASAVNTTTTTSTYNHNRHPVFYIG